MPPTREELRGLLSRAALRGQLGLFVGTGLSIDATDGDALSFEGLLESVASTLGLSHDFNDAVFARRSYPQIASRLLQLHCERNTDAVRAEQQFRETIARKVHLLPTPEKRAAYGQALSVLRPAWVVTTNYDLILESLIEGSETLVPSQPLAPSSERTPIYHLHGQRRIPSTIKITEEDYVGLLAGLDYQRVKLPLLFAESTTLMIGYALGDINVRAGIAWARSFGVGSDLSRGTDQGLVVQALYKHDTPANEPYEGPDGVLVVEVDDLEAFLSGLAFKRSEDYEAATRIREEIEAFLVDAGNTEAVVDEDDVRNRFLRIVGEALPYVASSAVVDFLDRTLDPVWSRAREDGGFTHYNTYLELVLDVIGRVDHERCNPSLTAYLADALDRVGGYMSADGVRHFGESWEATATWQRRRGEIVEPLRSELTSYARSYGKYSLLRLLE